MDDLGDAKRTSMNHCATIFAVSIYRAPALFFLFFLLLLIIIDGTCGTRNVSLTKIRNLHVAPRSRGWWHMVAQKRPGVRNLLEDRYSRSVKRPDARFCTRCLDILFPFPLILSFCRLSVASADRRDT